MSKAKELRYYVMLALYFPILLYAVSTFDVSEETFAVTDYRGVSVGEQTVLLGQEFKAKTFLAAQRMTTADKDTAGIQPKLIAGESLSAMGDSLLVMDTRDLLQPDEDQKRVSYEAYYEVPQLGGGKERFPVSGSFTVRRPEIVAKTETAQALYRLCRERLRLSVPGIDDQSLRISGPSGSVSGTTLPLSPTGDNVTVDVYLKRSGDEDLLLGQREFAVIDPPRPQVQVFGPQGQVSSGDPIERRRAVLRFEVVANQEFKTRYPEDATYRPTSARVFLRRGETASEELGTFELGDDGRLVLTQELRNTKPGDQIIVRLQGIVRINHQGRQIDVPLRENSRTFGFILS